LNEISNALLQYFTQADITQLRAAGFDQPFHSLEEGVRDFVQSLRGAE
jgi:ADP-L-glycero-D-manno-heptose 6-epimerase